MKTVAHLGHFILAPPAGILSSATRYEVEQLGQDTFMLTPLGQDLAIRADYHVSARCARSLPLNKRIC